VPSYRRFVLDNRMVVYLMEDHATPRRFFAGQSLRTGRQVGLAGLVGTVMRLGGTQQHSADELNQLLEQRAATLAGLKKFR